MCLRPLTLSMILLAWAMAAPAALPAPPAAPLAPGDRLAMAETLARLDGLDPAAVARMPDDALRKLIISRAVVELGQRLRPSSVDRLWALQPERRDVGAEVDAAVREGRLAAWLAQLSPADPELQALINARARYARLAAAGGWPAIAGGPALKEGDRHGQIRDLRRRLAAEGYASPPSGDPELFDADLGKALIAHQRSHGVEADGVLGPATRAALNVPARARLDQIEANLERWRWLPRPLPADRLEVDTGGAEATLYERDKPVLQMRAIVGDRRHHTPMFASRIEAVIFNPAWRVPSSIAANEILPRARRDPGYLARNDFTFRNGRLEQRPGPKNALGAVKFDLPSPFGVYLHDTPGKAAFARADRALSHGCMRLEKPRELAAILLQPQGGSAASVDAAIKSGATSRVALRRPVALYVVYRTMAVTPTGEVAFRPDPYGWDHKLAAALSQTTVDSRGSPTGSDCAE